jgi:hypothetical protein
MIQVVGSNEKDIRPGGFAFDGRIGKRAVRSGTEQKPNKRNEKESTHRAVPDEGRAKNVTQNTSRFAAKGRKEHTAKFSLRSLRSFVTTPASSGFALGQRRFDEFRLHSPPRFHGTETEFLKRFRTPSILGPQK